MSKNETTSGGRTCSTCVYWRRSHQPTGAAQSFWWGVCKFMPETVKKQDGDWCGQHMAAGQDQKGFWRGMQQSEKAA